MATGRMSKVLQYLRGTDAGMSDGQLLSCFISRRDEAAFAARVRRHGPMVWGVCRRVLGSHHDAEDAFQATFLVLFRKAASISSRSLLANYLYGVAHRTALKARAAAVRRQMRERQVKDMPEPVARPQELAPDAEPLLDEELSRLPDKYRVPIVLCDLEGKTRREAARQLGWPEGTVAGRLARGRTLLAKQMSHRGVTLSGGALAVLLAREAAAARVPAAVTFATVKAAGLFATGKAAAPGVLSAEVESLTQGVLKAMLMTKIKTALGVCLAVGFLVLGSACGYRALAADKAAAAPADKKNELRDTLLLLDNQFWEALSKNDTDTLRKILADDYVAYDPAGHHWNRAKTLEFYQDTRVCDVKFLSEREVFRIDGHTALLIYEVKFRGESRAGPSACHQRNTAVWVQRDGGWFVKFSQCAHLPDPAPPAKVEAKPTFPEILIQPLPATAQVVPWPPPGAKIEPTIFPSGPVQVDPSQVIPLDPFKGVPLDPAQTIPLDPSKFFSPTPKVPDEPKGIGKGPGNPNADKDGR
jgi:RNA polymerase sigma factor (sigma-70 family)